MIGVLTSGVALGVHVPGLLLAQRMRERGVHSEIFVLERLLPESKRATTAQMKYAFHRDFRVALTGQRLAVDPSAAVPDEKVRELAGHWRRHGLRRLVVFSGFWLSIVERCAAFSENWLEVDICHVDSVPSPSFRAADQALSRARQMWLADAVHSVLPCTIPVSTRAPLRWAEREPRLLAHGGGWGMGTYRQRANELRERGFELDIVAYEPADLRRAQDLGIRYFMIDPQWHPWLDDGFPPFGAADGWGDPVYVRGTECHGSFELARSALAMISKPGGGTLLDSLHSATPLVLLEPFGAHEARNAELWEQLGFGITLERWRDADFDLAILEGLHDALLCAAPGIPDYARMLVEEISR